VPKRYAAVDDRGVIRVSLKTRSEETARLRRDALIEADDLYWASLIDHDDEAASAESTAQRRAVLIRRYRRASARAMARGFVYSPAVLLAESDDLAALLARLAAVDRKDKGAKSQEEAAEAEALLGGAPVPSVLLSEAFEIYCDEIAIGDLLNKSPNQKRAWKKTKQRAINYFIEIVEDKPILAINREDALKFYNWWAKRITAKSDAKRRGANTANRDLGNLRKLYKDYCKHIGDEDRPNPFRNLNFKEASLSETPPFEDDWVRTRILAPGVFNGLNEEARLIIFSLIETGCRPSEIANLRADDIRLDADVPHIRIRPAKDREIKTSSSIRDIPLVGVSLAAMKYARQGFPHYRDKNDLLSASLMKAFRNRGLFPTKSHVIYSFRHSFEKRMQEAGLDYALRCLLMGHATDRPAYGDGGSLEYRRDELLKIAHPYPEGLF
jgi:integrase